MGSTSGEDPALLRLREICLRLPGVVETSSWGHANWRVGKKLFASFEEYRGARIFSFFAGAEREEEFLSRRRFFPPRYTDHHGWVCLRLDRDTDWKEIRRLAGAAHDHVTAPP